MRLPTSCTPCRQAKRRCIRHELKHSCTYCQKRQLICESKSHTGRAAQRILASQSPAASSTSIKALPASENQLRRRRDLSEGTAIELVEHFLDKFHGRPYTIFHPATLRSQVKEGTLKKPVLYSICAIGCKFSRNPEARNYGSDLAAESRRLLQADISNICLENIQACILVATLSVGHGDTAAEALFIRIATAMAEILNLNAPAPNASLLDQETRRRVWYALVMIDTWCISGQGLRSHLYDVTARLGLPGNDWSFIVLHPEQLEDDTPGMWAQLVTLVPHFAPIHSVNRSAAEGDIDKIGLDQAVEELSGKLEQWKEQLPAEAQMNQENLHLQQKRGLGGLLISLHLAYHHFATLLYFCYLELQRPAPSIELTYATCCKKHAASFSSLLRQSRQLKNCDVVYPNVSHMATVSSSVLVHTLLFGDQEELESTRQDLHSNFEALIELAQHWPSTIAMMQRLTTFQDICLLSTESGTHKLDGWMLRFLVEHSLAIGTKKPQASPLTLNMDSTTISTKAKEYAEKGRYMSFQTI